MDFNGSEPKISLMEEEGWFDWQSLAVTMGTFVYVGSPKNTITDPATNRELSFENDFYRLGFEIEPLYKNLRLRMNAILGQDRNPQGPRGTGTSEKSLWLMAQGQYIFMQNILAAFRYEHQDIEHEGITHRYIPSVVYAPWQNVKFALEYLYEIQPHIQPEYINREYTFRVHFAY